MGNQASRFGPLLKKYRVQKGFKQRELAIKLGVVQSTIVAWEKGERVPKREMIKKIADALLLEKYQEDGLLLTGGFQLNGSETYDLSSETGQIVASLLIDPVRSILIEPLGEDPLIMFAEGWAKIADARLAKYKRNWKEAITLSAEGINKIDEASALIKSYFLDMMGTAHAHLGKRDDAEKNFKDLSKLIRKTSDRYIRGKVYAHMGELQRDISDWESAENNLNAAMKEFSANGNNEKRAWVQRKIGLIHLFKGDLKRGQFYLKASEDWFLDSGKEYDYELAKLSLAKGWMYGMSGEWNHALRSRHEGLERAENYRIISGDIDRYLLMQAHLYLGYDYRMLDDLDNSLKHLNEALKLSKNLQDQRNRGLIYLGLARVYLKKQNFDAATRFFQYAVNDDSEEANHLRHARSLLFWGSSYLQPGNIDYGNAKNKLDHAKSLFVMLDHNYYLSQTQIYLTDFYHQTEQYDEIESCIQEGVDFAKKGPYYKPLSLLYAYRGWIATEGIISEKWAEDFALSLESAALFNENQCIDIGNILNKSLRNLTKKQSREKVAAQCRALAELFSSKQFPEDKQNQANSVQAWLKELEIDPLLPLKLG